GLATAASANGKLAPHNTAAGRMAHRQRAQSIWKVNQGLVVSRGSIGQYGSDTAICHAVQAMPAASSSWHQPSAARAVVRLPQLAPSALPRPRPIKNVARMSAKA